MSSLSKQVSTENESFYVLQSPYEGPKQYHIGKLMDCENFASTRHGFFANYEGKAAIQLAKSDAVLSYEDIEIVA